MAAVIGSLRIEVSAAIAKFQSDMGKAANSLGSFSTKYERMAARIESVGKKLTISLTAPIVAFGVTTAKVAGDYQASMNKVEAATQATATQVKQLNDAAIAFGKDKSLTATASEAAETMLSLAKNGLSVTDILGGATKATLKLAAATGGDFDLAANVTTDTMQQFGKKASDMSDVVDKITGALVASKFSFDDYRLAIGQAGGVAGGLGISFEDFNTALAATAGLFASGSDAGTSFKTFLTKLAPSTKQEAQLMKDLGLNFFDAQGHLKSLGEIAQILQDKLGGLNDKAKQQVLTKLFGTDAMRTAIALMNQGADGIAKVGEQINAVSADSQIEALTKGLNGMATQAKKSFENLAIAIGNSGFLDWVTSAVKAATGLMDAIAGLPRPVLAFATATAAVLAVIGPVTYAMGALIGTFSTFGKVLNIVTTGISIVPRLIGAVTAAMNVQVVSSARLSLAIRGVAVAEAGATAGALSLTAALGMLGIAAAVFAVAAAGVWLLYKATYAEDEAAKNLRTSTDAASKATDAFSDSAKQAALETGKQREETLRNAAALKIQAEQAIKAARANIVLAKSRLEQLKQDQKYLDAAQGPSPTVGPMGASIGASGGQIRNEGEQRTLKKTIDAQGARIDDLSKQVDDAQAIINAGNAPLALPPTPPHGLSPGTESDLLGGSPKEKADKLAKATRKYGDELVDMQRRVAKGLNELTQPATLVAVNDIYQKIDDITQAAKEAGVPVENFAGQISALKDRVEKLKLEGLAKEAETFRLEVEKSGRAVDSYAKGGLTPLEAKLQDVDNAFENMRDSIQAAIDANEVLAASNPEAAKAMQELQNQLVRLADAHNAATAAAKEQYAQEEKIANLQAGLDNQATREAIRTAQQNNGTFGPSNADAERMQGIEDDLTKQRLESAKKIAELDSQITEAKRVGDADQLARLEAQKALEVELYDIVSTTTATQIDAAAKIKSAFENFTSSLSEDLSTMIVNWKGDISGLNDIFKELARQLFIKPVTDSLSNGLSGMLQGIFKSTSGGGGGGAAGGGGGFLSSVGNGIKSLFSGFHAKGGVIRPGQWGVVGEEGPEPAFGGTSGLSIVPHSAASGNWQGASDTYNFNITTPDPNAFRMSARQIGRQAKKALNNG